jgi:hypothetical protein
VAGKLGLARNSLLTRDRIFSLKKHDGLNSAHEIEVDFFMGSSPDLAALDFSFPLVSNPQGLYRFVSSLKLGEDESASGDPVLIEFDPSLAYIELPGARFGGMFQDPKFRVTAEGFVHFSESENTRGIELSLANGISIPFPKLFDTSVRADLGWTPLSIRLVDGGDYVVRVGRQLIRSTERVIVDNSKGRIIFCAKEHKKQMYFKNEEVLLPTIPLVPLFAEEPEVFSESVPVRARFAVLSPSFRPEGLVLFKERPSEIADADEGRFAERFVFIRSRPLINEPFRHIRLGASDASYTVDVNLRNPRLFGFVQFMLLPRARPEGTDDSSSLIFLLISDSTVSVLIEGPCPQGCGELGVLDLEAPRVRDLSDEKENCAFCVSELAPGETEQVLRCKHRFHLACVQPWLETRKTECIICRKPVGYRK